MLLVGNMVLQVDSAREKVMSMSLRLTVPLLNSSISTLKLLELYFWRLQFQALKSQPRMGS
nr:hypothetical protein Iba_chr03bCG18280 [Ipomoea batatas]GMC78119.1 hypothetical protein Iba_chr03fCG4970 [Ipomoea batatas]